MVVVSEGGVADGTSEFEMETGAGSVYQVIAELGLTTEDGDGTSHGGDCCTTEEDSMAERPCCVVEIVIISTWLDGEGSSGDGVGVGVPGITAELEAKDSTIWVDPRDGSSCAGVGVGVGKDTGDSSRTVDDCAVLATDSLTEVACPDEGYCGGPWKLAEVELSCCCCADDTCVLCELMAATEDEETSWFVDVIGPLDADADPSGLENKLRVEVPSTGETLSLVETSVGFCGSAEELELRTTGDGSLFGVEGIEVLVSFRQDGSCLLRTGNAISLTLCCDASRLFSAERSLEWYGYNG
jgi:hypothetical protein